MNQFSIDEDRCIQCGECAEDCPAGIISMNGFPRIINEEACYQCQHCLAVCPTGAVSILGKDPDRSIVLAGHLPEPEKLAVLIKGRRTVRRYRDQDLAPGLIDELLDIACYAPTGVNSQQVLFTVVRERAVMDGLRRDLLSRLAQKKNTGELPEGRIGQYLGWAVKVWQEEGKDAIFRGAPHLLVTSAPKDIPCPVQDTHIALTTFQLMAHSRGVGTVWAGLFMHVLSLCPDLAGRLAIPGDHLIDYAMAFGAPAVEYYRTVQRGPALINIVK